MAIGSSRVLSSEQKAMLDDLGKVLKRDKLEKAPDVFAEGTLVEITAPRGTRYWTLFLDDWGNAVSSSEHIKVLPGELGMILGPVHRSYTWSCTSCHLEPGNPASRRHHRMILIQGISRAVPVCRLKKVAK